MSAIEAASLAASISDLTAGSSRSTIAEALSIVVKARRIPGLIFTRGDVLSAAATQLGREQEEVPEELVNTIWGSMQPWGTNMLDQDWDRLNDAVCEAVLTMTKAAAK